MARQLTATLDVSPRRMHAALRSPAPFVWLKRRVPPDVAQRVKALALPGVGSVPTQRRVYPHADLAAALLGFVDVDANGLEGIEAVYNDDLLGHAARSLGERDARGRTIFVHGGPRQPETLEVRLALDARLQYIARHELERAVHDSGARAGTVVVLDPRTFAVLALAQLPGFDPNRPAESGAAARRNRGVSDCYEPGSTLKALVVAAALDAGQIVETDRFFCENGAYRVGRHTIHDVRPYGDLSVERILAKSSNIGALKIGERLGAARYRTYLQAFGLGQPTGIDLPGEIAGILPERWSRIKLATVSFGQGVAVTPLQLACAYGALANDGMLMRPYVVSEVVNAEGEVVRANRPTRCGRSCGRRPRGACAPCWSASSSRTQRDGAPRVPGFRVAGKTGTSQKIDPRGGYSETGRVASFVGMVPAEQPHLVILVIVDEPQGVTGGGAIAAPVFREIARRSLATWGSGPGPGPHRPPAGCRPPRHPGQRRFAPRCSTRRGRARIRRTQPARGHAQGRGARRPTGRQRHGVRHAAAVRTDARTGEPVVELTLEAGW